MNSANDSVRDNDARHRFFGRPLDTYRLEAEGKRRKNCPYTPITFECSSRRPAQLLSYIGSLGLDKLRDLNSSLHDVLSGGDSVATPRETRKRLVGRFRH